MTHQGEILQEAIKNSGISITRIVEELGITRPTMYRKFKDDTLDVNFVNDVGKIIGHDFSDDFTISPQASLTLVSSVTRNAVTSGVTAKQSSSMTDDNDLKRQLLGLQTKYIALLEAYNELLLKVYGQR